MLGSFHELGIVLEGEDGTFLSLSRWYTPVPVPIELLDRSVKDFFVARYATLPPVQLQAHPVFFNKEKVSDVL